MTNYTIIAYRPNGVDTCRGCVMGTTGSEIETGFFQDALEAATFAVGFEDRPHEADPSYSAWEITLLVDGLDENAWWADKDWREEELDPFDEFRSLHAKAIEAVAEMRRQEKKRKDEADAEQRRRQALAAAKAKEESERAQLRSLMEKYSDEA